MKTCSRCGVEKPLDDFAKSAAKKDGRTYSCKACIEKGRKERLAADPERVKLLRERDAARKREKSAEIYRRIKERKEIDAEYAERLKGYAQKYAEKNREKELKRGREYRLNITADADAREERNAYMREWTARHSERINIARREKLKNDPEYAKRVRENARLRHAANPERKRSLQLKTNYGITLDDYRSMYREQEGKCAICGTSCPDHGKMGLVVDHCHKNGHVRKLLCTHCNKGIGQFKEDPEILQKAIEYLKERGQS